MRYNFTFKIVKCEMVKIKIVNQACLMETAAAGMLYGNIFVMLSFNVLL